jgi:hypothetical protein
VISKFKKIVETNLRATKKMIWRVLNQCISAFIEEKKHANNCFTKILHCHYFAYRNIWRLYPFFRTVCWFVVNVHPEGHATSHADRHRFSCLQEYAEMGFQVPSCYCMLLIQLSRSKFIKIACLLCRPPNCLLQDPVFTTYQPGKNRVLRPKVLVLTGPTPSFVLPLSDSGVDDAWDTSNRRVPFLPRTFLFAPTLCSVTRSYPPTRRHLLFSALR